MTEKTAFSFRLTRTVALIHPFWRYAAMFSPQGHSFLLDSGMDPGRLGQFSFLGGNPVAVLRAFRKVPQKHEAAFTWELKRRVSPSGETLAETCAAATVDAGTGDPFLALRELHRSYYSGVASKPEPDSTNGSFRGGLVGGFGYGLAHAVENLPDTGTGHSHLPDMIFMACDEVLAMDHRTGLVELTITGRGSNAAAAKEQAVTNQAQFMRWLDNFATANLDDVVSVQTIARLAHALPPRNHTAHSPGSAFSIPLKAHFNRTTYGAAVEKCRDHIFRGDVFEVCLTHQLEASLPMSPWKLYQVLRHINPAPFAAWLQFPDFQVASASPERFLNLTNDGHAESRPIKGTRTRGQTPAQDRALAQNLATSEKDRAENVMIVDLVRNDLGKVCRTGSVTVPEMLVVEKYSTVFQLVSTVQGVIKDGNDAFDLVRACFPGGSMTGAPKIRAMQIIDSLEPVSRGLYSGAIGYIDASGSMDLSIVIRTLICKDQKATFGVGGAIVADSDPDTEYTETLDKAQSLVDALTIVQNL